MTASGQSLPMWGRLHVLIDQDRTSNGLYGSRSSRRFKPIGARAASRRADGNRPACRATYRRGSMKRLWR